MGKRLPATGPGSPRGKLPGDPSEAPDPLRTALGEATGAPSMTRTCDLQVRNPTTAHKISPAHSSCPASGCMALH